MITRKQLLSFWPDVLGIGALFLPFVPYYSPMRVLVEFFDEIYDSYRGSVAALAGSVVLAIPIAAWQCFRVFRGVATKTGRVLNYTLATAAMLSPILFSADMLILLGQEGRSHSVEDLFMLAAAAGSAGILIAINVLLLRHNLRSAAPVEVTTGVFLVGAYLPNAAFSLVFFFPHTIFTRWDIGAYVVLAACIGYILRILDLIRYGTKAYRPEESSV